MFSNNIRVLRDNNRIIVVVNNATKEDECRLGNLIKEYLFPMPISDSNSELKSETNSEISNQASKTDMDALKNDKENNDENLLFEDVPYSDKSTSLEFEAVENKAIMQVISKDDGENKNSVSKFVSPSEEILDKIYNSRYTFPVRLNNNNVENQKLSTALSIDEIFDLFSYLVKNESFMLNTKKTVKDAYFHFYSLIGYYLFNSNEKNKNKDDIDLIKLYNFFGYSGPNDDLKKKGSKILPVKVYDLSLIK